MTTLNPKTIAEYEQLLFELGKQHGERVRALELEIETLRLKNNELKKTRCICDNVDEHPRCPLHGYLPSKPPE